MSATVAVVQTSAAGVGVAVEVIGTTAFQQVKLVGGEAGGSTAIEATAGAPAAGSAGLIVALKGGASVSAGVSGTVSISGPVTVNTAATVAGASVTAQVSGTVTIAPTILTVNTAATVAGASVTAQVSGIVTIASTAIVSLATGGTLATVLGTLLVTIANIAPVTTAVSVSVSGLPVWLNPTQQIVVSGLVGHSVTGSVNIVSTAIVSLATGGTIATVLGTQLVSVAASATVGTIIAVSGVTAVSAVSTVVTLLGTLNVTVVGGAVVATATQVASTGAIMWLAPTQTMAVVSTVGTVVAISGVTAVSVVSTVGTVLNVSGVTAVSNLSTLVTLLNMPYVTTAWATGVSTGEIVIAKDVARTNWILNITATQGAPSSMMLFTVMTGNTTGAAAGTSLYVVPAGRILCIQNAYVIAVSSAVLGPAQLVVVVGSAAASVSLTATVGMAMVMPYALQATTVAYQKPGLGYVSAGSTMGIAISGTSHSIIGVVLDGYLF